MADAQTTFIALNKQQRDFALQQIAAEHKLTTAETQHYFTTLRNTGAAKNLTAAQAEQILSTVALANSKENVTRQDMILAAREVNVQLRMAGVTREARIQIMALLGLDNASINAGNGLLALKQAELAVEKQTLSMGQSIKLAMATNPLGFWLTVVSTAVSIIIPLITKLHKSSEEIIELGEEAASTMDELTSTFNEQVSTVNELGESYAKLAQGVNQFTGQNLSLSTEDYEEYLEISNKIAELMPDLVVGYDSQGNAILNLQGDYESINNALEEYIRLQKEALAEDAQDKLPDIASAATKTVEGYMKDLDSEVTQQFEARQALIEKMTKTTSDGQEYFNKHFAADVGSYKTLLRELGVEFESIQQGDYTFLDFDDADLRTKWAEYLGDVGDAVRKTNQDIMKSYSELNKNIITALGNNDIYTAFSDDQIAALQHIIGELNWHEMGLKSSTDIMNYVQTELLPFIQNSKDAFELAFNLLTQFNGDEISVGEFQSKMVELVATLEALGADTEIITAVKLLLDVENSPNVDALATQAMDALGRSVTGQTGSELRNNTLYQQIVAGLNSLDASDLNKFKSFMQDVELTGVTTWEEILVAFNDYKAAIREDANYPINFSNLDAIKEGVAALAQAYTDLTENQSVSYGTLSSINEQFGGSVENIDDYITSLAGATSATGDFEEIAKELIIAKVDNTYASAELADADADVIAAMLKEAGVANSVEAAHALIARAKVKAAAESGTLADMTDDEIRALYDEVSACDNAAAALVMLELKKALVNGTTVNTAADVQNILAIAQACGIASGALTGLSTALGALSGYNNLSSFYTQQAEKFAAQGNYKLEALYNSKAAYANTRALEEWAVAWESLMEDLDFGDAGGGGGSGSSQTVAEALKTELDAMLAVYEHEIFILEKNRDTTDFGDVSKTASQIISYYKSMQAAVHALAEEYRAMGMEDTSEEIMELQKQWWEYEDAINSVKESVVSDLLEIANATSQTLDDIQNVLDTFQKAADEYAQNGGFISVDTFQEILDLGPQYLQYLQDENGLLVINRENINKVIAAKTEQLALDNAMAYVERLRLALNSESLEDLNELLYATKEATNSTWGLVYANLALLDLNSDQYKAALHNINAIRSLAQTAIAGIGQTGASLTEQLEEMKQGLDDILQYVMDMIEWEVEQQIELLEQQKEAYADIIERQKESLELKKQEADYSEEVADKVKELAKLQERINLLSLDDSRDAQAQKIALEEEMAEIQKELASAQADYALEAQQDSLDKMQESYEAEKNAEIEVLEDSISSQEKLYQKAIARIESGWDTLYEDLITWNYKAGSSLQSELVSAWEAALAAAKRYGSFVNAPGSIDADIAASQSGSSSIVGSSASGSASQNEAAIESIINQMYRNAQAWHNADDTRRKELANENQELGAKLPTLGVSAWYDNKTGTWYVGNEKLFDKYKQYCYHTGGVVGDNGTLKQNEVLSLLEAGELVLDEPKQKSLYRIIDFVDVLSEKIGKVLNPADFSNMLRNVESVVSGIKVPAPTGVEATPSVHFGDVYIYGGSDETVAKHREVNRQFVNDVIRQLNIKK